MKDSISQDNAIATLIHWKSIEDKERIEKWLKKLQDQGFIESSHTGTYNENYGTPVWYIP